MDIKEFSEDVYGPMLRAWPAASMFRDKDVRRQYFDALGHFDVVRLQSAVDWLMEHNNLFPSIAQIIDALPPVPDPKPQPVQMPASESERCKVWLSKLHRLLSTGAPRSDYRALVERMGREGNPATQTEARRVLGAWA